MPPSSFPDTDDFESRKRTLLATDPAEFVAARNALTRDLRAAHDRENAAAVAKLRRPPIPVWALNRVAHDAPDAINALADAAATARNAQTRAAAGGARPALREANVEVRRAIDDLARAALAAIKASGRSTDAYGLEVDRAVAEVAGSERLLEELRRGMLVRLDNEDDDVISQLAASVDVPAATATRAAPQPRNHASAKKRARLEARLAEDLNAANDAHDAFAAAEEALRSAQQRRDRARRAAEQADRAVERSRAALDRLSE